MLLPPVVVGNLEALTLCIYMNMSSFCWVWMRSSRNRRDGWEFSSEKNAIWL